MKRASMVVSAALAGGLATAFSPSVEAGSRTPDEGINFGVSINDVRRGTNQLLHEQRLGKEIELIDDKIEEEPITIINDYSTTNIEEQEVFQPGSAEALSIGNWIQNSCNGTSVSDCIQASIEDSDVRAQTADERGPGDLDAGQGNTANENGDGDVIVEDDDHSFRNHFDPHEPH